MILKLDTLLILCLIQFLLNKHTSSQSCHEIENRIILEKEMRCSGFVGRLEFNQLLDGNIDKLSFSKNDITEITASSFSKNLTNVQQICLDNNHIKSISANVFKYLPNIKEIDLSYNKIETLDSETFATNLNLRTIDLSGNAIQTLHVSLIQRLDNLEELILSNNPLVCNSETNQTLHYLEQKNIKTLFLKDCSLKELEKTIETGFSTNVVRKVDTKTAASEEITIAKFLPLIGVLLIMLVLAVGLGFAVAALCLKVSQNRNSHNPGRSSTESGNCLLPSNELRNFTSSDEDKYGYLIPSNPKTPVKYVEVVYDPSNEPLISLHSEENLLRLNTYKPPELPIPDEPSATLRDSTYLQPNNHVYEEIKDQFYVRRMQPHMQQPYSCVKN